MNNTKIHYVYNIIYPAIILISTIIILITVQWATIPNLAQLISFGLTLTSLFLSLIAIFFAIFSNFSALKSTANLEETSSKISNITKELQQTVIDIGEKVTHVSSSVTGLEKSVEKSHQELLGKLSQKEQIPKATNTISSAASTKSMINNVEVFLKLSSYNGLLILYACKMAKDNNISFKLSDLKFEDYSYGFIVACFAMGFVSFTYKNNTFVVTGINTDIDKHIENSILTRTETFSSPVKEGYKKTLEELKKYFKS
ncbi:MAG: hypothetical protein PHE49_10295 [bacterium]|nr:hypothetical protein [bacterium]